MDGKVNKTHTGESEKFPNWIQAQIDAWDQSWKALLHPEPSSLTESPDSAETPASAGIAGEALKLYIEALEKSASFLRSPEPAESKTEEPSDKTSMQHTWGTLFAFQKICLDMADQLKAAVPGGGLPDLTREAAKFMNARFKEEFQKVLNIPPLGLMRFYQERINKNLEAFTSFQSALTEFYQLLMVPLEEASDALQEELDQAFKGGRQSAYDPQALYRLWIKKLESYYLSLLKSQLYTETLAKTLSSLCDYQEAKKKFLLDLLKEWPIATTQDVDEISKDLYLLKKRVRELEKR